MKCMTASLSRYWLWKFYLGALFFLFTIQNILWAVLLFSFCTNFWSNVLIWFCNVVLSRRIMNLTLPQKLCVILLLSRLLYSYQVWHKIFKWNIVSEYLFFQNLHKHKNNTVKNSFLHAFGFCLLKPKGFPEGYACLHLFFLQHMKWQAIQSTQILIFVACLCIHLSTFSEFSGFLLACSKLLAS